MKSNLVLTLIITLFLGTFVACMPEPANDDTDTKPPATKIAKVKKIDENTIVGKYDVRIDTETLKALMGDEMSEDDDLGVAFAAGFLSMLKLEAEFTKDGYVKIGGGVGSLGIPIEKVKGVTYKLKGKNLTIFPPKDSDEEEQTLTVASTDSGMALEMDSVKIMLDRK